MEIYTHRPNSDLDIIIFDSKEAPINPSIASLLAEDFENSVIPYKIDIVFRSRITDDFYTNIEKSLKPFQD